jgi:MFS family permease
MTQSALDAEKNILLTNIFSSLKWFLIFLPVSIPYFKTLNFTLYEIFILQSTFSFVVLILDIPSGSISDKIGRKNTFMISAAFDCMAAYFILFGTTFEYILLYEIFIGISLSLRSGNDISFIVESSRVINKPNSSVQKLIGRLTFLCRFSETLAALCVGALVYYGINYVIYVYCTVLVLPIFLTPFMTEVRQVSSGHKANSKNVADAFRYILSGDPLIFLVSVSMIMSGGATLVAVLSYQHIWSEYNIPLEYFGYSWAFFNLITAFGAKFYPASLSNRKIFHQLFTMVSLPLIGFTLLALVSENWVILTGVLFSLSRAINSVGMQSYINEHTPSSIRATVNSIISAGMRAVFVTLAPVIGHMMDKYSLNTVYGIVASSFAIPTIFFAIYYINIRSFKEG